MPQELELEPHAESHPLDSVAQLEVEGPASGVAEAGAGVLQAAVFQLELVAGSDTPCLGPVGGSRELPAKLGRPLP